MNIARTAVARTAAVLALIVLMAGCDTYFQDPQEGNVWEDQLVEFKPTSDAVTFAADSDASTTYEMTVQFISAHVDQSTAVTFQVADGTTAQEGVHYNLLTEGGQTTIPPNSSFGQIEVEVLGSGLDNGEAVDLIVELTDGGDVPPAANVGTFELEIAKAAE